MHRVGIDFKATLGQTVLGLLGGAVIYRYLARPLLTGEPVHRPALSPVPTAGPSNAIPNAQSHTAQQVSGTAATGNIKPLSSAARARVRALDSPDALDEIGRNRTVLLVNRGYSKSDSASAHTAFAAAADRFKDRDLVFFEVTDESAYIPATTLLTRLGISHEKPFVMILENFIKTERKYLSHSASVPGTKEITKFVEDFLDGRLQPARLGQPRPAGDQSPHCKDLTEVVTDSFHELVLDPYADVLLECYTRRCDACKAFAPRYRMLAGLCARMQAGQGGAHREAQGQQYKLRIAAMDILDNDREIEHVPEKWTPSLRLFLANGQPGSRKESVPFNNTVAPSDGGEGEARTSTSTGTKVFLPTLPELIQFLGEHTDGRFPLTPALLDRADTLEQQAVALESAYDATLKYMQLWQSYNELVEDSRAQAIEEGEKEGSERMQELQAAQKTADTLRSLVLDTYRFLVDQAGDLSQDGEVAAEGDAGVATALTLLDSVADHVAKYNMSEIVSGAVNGPPHAQDVQTGGAAPASSS